MLATNTKLPLPEIIIISNPLYDQQPIGKIRQNTHSTTKLKEFHE